MELPSIDRLPFDIVDALLVVVLLLGLWRGWRRGFVAGTLELACLGASLVVAYVCTPPLGGVYERNGWLAEPWASPAAFLGVFVVAQIVVGGLVGRLFRPVVVLAHVRARGVDRVFGLLPGAANGLINAMVAAVLLSALPLNDALTRASQDSVISARLAAPAGWIEERLGPIFDPAVERAQQALTVAPKSPKSPEPHERVELPFTVRDTVPRPDLEAAMLVLVNAERARAGIRPLAADAETVEVSRDHSRDMLARGYFAHLTPEGKTPFDRLRAARLGYRAAGENLALARTLETAHQGLMNSPGHRANILLPAFGRLGIGIVDGGRRGLMITQTFRN